MDCQLSKTVHVRSIFDVENAVDYRFFFVKISFYPVLNNSSTLSNWVKYRQVMTPRTYRNYPSSFSLVDIINSTMKSASYTQYASNLSRQSCFCAVVCPSLFCCWQLVSSFWYIFLTERSMQLSYNGNLTYVWIL